MVDYFKRKKILCIIIGVVGIIIAACIVLYGIGKKNEPGEVPEESHSSNNVGGNNSDSNSGGSNSGNRDDSNNGSSNSNISEDMIDMNIQNDSALGDAASEQIQQTDVTLRQEYNTDILKDKTISILGDSISTYEGWIPAGYVDFFPIYGEVSDVDETWWKRLIDDTGMQFCANSSSAGSTCAGDSLSIDNPKYACSNYRIDDLIGKNGLYPDIIIVYMGTNDLLTSVPIGENDGLQSVEEGNIDNFSDAYSIILDKLESQYPGAQIFCATLTSIGDWGTNTPFINFINDLELTAEDYSDCIKLIAQNRGFGVIDLINCGITIDNMPEYVTDGVHLNTDGMKIVSEAAKAALIDSVY